MKQVLKNPGAKARLANWICSYMPKHDVYLELYGGSMAVLLNKPRCHIETVNDLHGEVVNFFKVLRDDSEELQRLIELTPYSREEYDKAYQESQNDLERARRFCVRCWQGIGCANLYHNGFKSGQQTTSPNPAKAWAELPRTIEGVSKRLQGVQIENLDAMELLKRYDTKDVFIYADPPYILSTRKSNLYKYEMSDKEHIVLLEALLNHSGKVMISGYDNDIYNHYLKGWRKAEKETLAEQGLKRTETIWMNYSNSQMNIFDFI